MKKKRVVEFEFKKEVVEPVKIKFKTSAGKMVTFIARKKTTRPVKVRFRANK